MTTHRNAHHHPTVVLLASIAPRTARSLLITVIRLVTSASSSGRLHSAVLPRHVQLTCGLARCASARGDEIHCNAMKACEGFIKKH
ncbi:hypothetical protein EDB83DRAFT_2477048, partial [Lactarius deliciosus]